MPAMCPGDRGQRELIGADDNMRGEAAEVRQMLHVDVTSACLIFSETVADIHWRALDPTAHNAAISIGSRFGCATVSIAQRFALAGLIAIAASSASAADLAPSAACPG